MACSRSLPGCPPRPESLIDGLIKLQNKVMVARPTEGEHQGGYGKRGRQIGEPDEKPLTKPETAA